MEMATHAKVLYAIRSALSPFLLIYLYSTINQCQKCHPFSEIPQFKDSYLIASQGMALMKVPFNATRYNPGVPIYMQASMTASSLDIDCIKKKVSK